jgi:hypothetical protein
MRSAHTLREPFDGGTEISLHKWNRMFLEQDIALSEWQTISRWLQSKNLLKLVPNQ